MPKNKQAPPKAVPVELSDEEVAHLQERLRRLGFKKLTGDQVRKLAEKPDTGALPSMYVHHWLHLYR